MDGEVFIKYEELVEKGFYPQQMTFSVDVGGHVFAKEDVKISNDLYSIEDWYKEYNKGGTRDSKRRTHRNAYSWLEQKI